MKGGIKILNEMVNWEIVKNRRIKLDLTYIISPEGQQSIKKFIYDHQVYQAGLKYLETLKKK